MLQRKGNGFLEKATTFRRLCWQEHRPILMILKEGRSDLRWRNPIEAIEKPNGKCIRLASNLMGLNYLVDKDLCGVPSIRYVIRATQGSKWFTVLVLKKGFYYIEIEEADKHKTAF